MNRTLVIILSALAATTVACKKRPKRLVPEAELRALDKAATAYFSRAAARECLRPVLAGHAAVDKRADAAIIAIVETTPVRVDAMKLAARHTDACSPYLPGRRGLRTLRLDKIAAAIVARANSLPAGQAVEQLVIGVRFLHDLTRGGSLMFAADAANQTKQITSAIAKHIPKLTATDAKRLDGWLKQLSASAPRAHTLVQDELYLTLLERVIPRIKHATWKPPGGWPNGKRPPPPDDDDDAVGHVFKYERDLLGLRWLAIRTEARAAADVCPPQVSYSDCADGLNKMAADHEAYVAQVGAEDLREVIRTSGKTEVVRTNAVDSLRETVRPDYKTSLADLAAANARLVELRLEISARPTANE